MEELRENMSQTNMRPEPQKYLADDEKETQDEEENEVADVTIQIHDLQQDRSAKNKQDLQGLSSHTAGAAYDRQALAPSADSRKQHNKNGAASGTPENPYLTFSAVNFRYAGSDISNAILLAEISMLRQEVTNLKEVYINEILALKSMVRTLLQAQVNSSSISILPIHFSLMLCFLQQASSRGS